MDRKIGAHLSTGGGIDLAIARAHAMGATCLQVFSGSPRMWRRTPLDRIDAAKIAAAQQKYAVAPLVTHALYLVNLASDNPETLQNSVMTLKHDLSFDAHISGAGVVVHLGSHQGRGWEASRDQIASQIAAILKATPTNSRFLIENSAGQQGKIASQLSEIRWLLDQLQSDRLGWCLDTCHAFAAGYAFSDNFSLYQPKNQKESNLFMDGFEVAQYPVLLAEIERLELLSTLQVIHVNDSRDPFHSGRDRHDNIGSGLIPAGELGYFLRQPQLAHIPLITEVPGFDGEGPDAANIKLIRDLLK